jgi:hypothetical protein
MYDHYKESKELAGLLAAEGRTAEANAILDAMKIGKSGTEIFMILRFRIRPLLDAADVSEETKGRLRILYKKIDEALT